MSAKFNAKRNVISIHALVKRATAYTDFLTRNLGISIHALVKRATIAVLVKNVAYFDFNPRPREEGDRFIVYIIPCLCISIHALVKRATGGVDISNISHIVFQSTPS